MKTFLVVVALVSVLAYWYPGIAAVPISTTSEESTEENSDESASNESVYLVKDVSYEVGLIDTVDLGNSSQIVVVRPEDRIETDDVTLWTAKNESTPENEMTTVAAPAEAETTMAETETTLAATNEQVNKLTTSETDQAPAKEDSTLANKAISV